MPDLSPRNVADTAPCAELSLLLRNGDKAGDSTMGSLPEEKDSALWSDTPKGPLSAYRARASFNSGELLLFWDGQDVIHFKKTIFST